MSSYKDRYTDLQMCLEDILRDKGKTAFRDGNQIVGMVRDLMPGKPSDWNMMQRMADCGILKAFADADNGNQTERERERAVHTAILKLVDLESIDEAKARSYVNIVAQALGWRIPTQPPKLAPSAKQLPIPEPIRESLTIQEPVSTLKPQPSRKRKSIWVFAIGLAAVLAIVFVSNMGRTMDPKLLEPFAQRRDTYYTDTAPGLLMPDDTFLYYESLNHVEFEKYPVLGSGLQRGQVETVTFLNSIESAPKDAWDASLNQDGQVLAWVEETENGLYHLYIAANGGVDGKYACTELFQGYNNVKVIHFNDSFRTEEAQNMSSMFYGCSSLQTLDLTELDTSKAYNISEMFYGCSALTELDVSSFDTSNVEYMRGVFWNCSGLTQLDLSAFHTENVTDMDFLFTGCSSLQEVNLSSFDTSMVDSMRGMFDGCESLISLNVSGFNTSSVTDMGNMFADCKTLTSLDVSSFDTSKAENMIQMFMGCENLTDLDVSGFDTSSVTNMFGMFQMCKSLTTLNLSRFDTSRVTDMGAMFNGCSNLETLNLSGWKTGEVTNMGMMFGYCNALKQLNLSGFDTSKVTDMSKMFIEWENVKGLRLGQLKTDSVVDYDGFMDEGILYQGKPWEELFA